MALWKDIIRLYDIEPEHRNLLNTIQQAFKVPGLTPQGQAVLALKHLSDNVVAYVAHRFNEEDDAAESSERLYLISKLRKHTNTKYPIKRGIGTGQHGKMPICYFESEEEHHPFSALMTNCVFLKGTYGGIIDLGERAKTSTWLFNTAFQLTKDHVPEHWDNAAQRERRKIIRPQVQAAIAGAFQECATSYPSIEQITKELPAALALAGLDTPLKIADVKDPPAPLLPTSEHPVGVQQAQSHGEPTADTARASEPTADAAKIKNMSKRKKPSSQQSSWPPSKRPNSSRSSTSSVSGNMPRTESLEKFRSGNRAAAPSIFFAAPRRPAGGALRARTKPKTLREARECYRTVYIAAAAQPSLATMTASGQVVVIDNEGAWQSLIQEGSEVWQYPDDSCSIA